MITSFFCFFIYLLDQVLELRRYSPWSFPSHSRRKKLLSHSTYERIRGCVPVDTAHMCTHQYSRKATPGGFFLLETAKSPLCRRPDPEKPRAHAKQHDVRRGFYSIGQGWDYNGPSTPRVRPSGAETKRVMERIM